MTLTGHLSGAERWGWARIQMDGNTGYRATGEGENRFRSQGNGVTHVTSKQVWAERRKPFETKGVGNRALLVRTSDIQREDRKLSQGRQEAESACAERKDLLLGSGFGGR